MSLFLCFTASLGFSVMRRPCIPFRTLIYALCAAVLLVSQVEVVQALAEFSTWEEVPFATADEQKLEMQRQLFKASHASFVSMLDYNQCPMDSADILSGDTTEDLGVISESYGRMDVLPPCDPFSLRPWNTACLSDLATTINGEDETPLQEVALRRLKRPLSPASFLARKVAQEACCNYPPVFNAMRWHRSPRSPRDGRGRRRISSSASRTTAYSPERHTPLEPTVKRLLAALLAASKWPQVGGCTLAERKLAAISQYSRKTCIQAYSLQSHSHTWPGPSESKTSWLPRLGPGPWQPLSLCRFAERCRALFGGHFEGLHRESSGSPRSNQALQSSELLSPAVLRGRLSSYKMKTSNSAPVLAAKASPRRGTRTLMSLVADGRQTSSKKEHDRVTKCLQGIVRRTAVAQKVAMAFSEAAGRARDAGPEMDEPGTP
eukprot:s4449_g4.t1